MSHNLNKIYSLKIKKTNKKGIIGLVGSTTHEFTMNSSILFNNQFGVAIFIYLLALMDQFDLASLIATPLFADYTASDFLTKTLTFVIVVVLLKRYFRGGQFALPEVDLQGKYAVVTGGNSGIGAETVKALCKLGCSVVIGARNNETAEEVMK
jgi:hypothetical protein